MTEYPEPNEDNWPEEAKLSKGVLTIKDGELGKITSDGLRGYICTVCGLFITKAHHIKPETYKVKYMGKIFYMECHVCNDCMDDTR